MKVPTMTASRSLAALAACTLASCAGAAGLQPPAARRPQPFAQSASSRAATSCLTAPCIYVTNPTNREIPRVAGRVLIFPANANGDAPPAAEIAGSKTHLGHPGGIAVDAQHNVYVANLRSVGVYAPGTYGNAPPARMIAGAHTSLLYPSEIAVDASGEIYVSQFRRHGHAQNVVVFAAGANGDVAPIRTIAGSRTKLYGPLGVAVDGSGNVYVGDDIDCCSGYITVYAAGAHGNVAPICTIGGKATQLLAPSGVAVDGLGNLYVADLLAVGFGSGYITVYAPGADGDTAPIREVGGGNTHVQSPLKIALDSARNIYLTDLTDPQQTPTVLVFASGSNGNVPPIHAISGSQTEMTNAFAIAVR
jgi:hypothetical protein